MRIVDSNSIESSERITRTTSWFVLTFAGMPLSTCAGRPSPSKAPATHRFELRDEGLRQPAPHAVKEAARRRPRRGADGLARVNTAYADNIGLL